MAVFGEDGGRGDSGGRSAWEAILHVEDPGPRLPQPRGKFLDANQVLEVARFDIQYCDWRARHDLLAIMLLHDKVRTTALVCRASVFSVCPLVADPLQP